MALALDAGTVACDVAAIEALRAREYARLDAQGQVYLDYTGAGVYADSHVRAHLEMLGGQVFGNPHSTNPTSRAATAWAERARASVLRFFAAPPDEYTVIFTSNASGALKLVGEAFPFAPGSRLLLTADNHNSVNGIREFARRRGARFRYLPLETPSLRVPESALEAALAETPRGGRSQAHLFAYPAQSNFSGVQHPLAWVPRARERGWTVLLDAAAFAPSNRLDVGRWQPDFVSLSFYKLFGYPTGVGCLIARREALARLCRPWFAGGTVTVATVGGDAHALAEAEVAFEDGTIDFLGLPAVELGLRYMDQIGIDLVHDRVAWLTACLLERLSALHHPGGAPLVRIYGPTGPQGRGGTVAFSVLARDGAPVDHHQVEAAASRCRTSLRSGCFCNPGCGEAALGLSPDEIGRLFREVARPTPEALQQRLPGRATGAVRASLGIATVPRDIDHLIALLQTFADEPAMAGRDRAPSGVAGR